MKLLLTSSGITNQSIENALARLVEKPFKKLNLTFIPTAANVQREDKSWLIDDLYNMKKLGFSVFEITDISAVPKSIWMPAVEQADILVFGGGQVEYLLHWLKKSGVARLLPRLLKTKVYMGISAGSMVTAKTVTLSSAGMLYFEDTGNFKDCGGLGFVDFEIRPHLNAPWAPNVRIDYLKKLAANISHPIFAIDDDTAIQVVNKEISVVSEGKWTRFH